MVVYLIEMCFYVKIERYYGFTLGFIMLYQNEIYFCVKIGFIVGVYSYEGEYVIVYFFLELLF